MRNGWNSICAFSDLKKNCALCWESMRHPKEGSARALGRPRRGNGALRALDAPAICDIKRLYVRPAFRGQLLAVRAQRPIREAHHIGYEKVRLDTVPGKIKQGHSAVSPVGVQDDNPFIMPLPCSIHCSWSLNWLLVLPRSAPGEGILRIFFHCADLVKSR